jgi:hypothetical protein
MSDITQEQNFESVASAAPELSREGGVASELNSSKNSEVASQNVMPETDDGAQNSAAPVGLDNRNASGTIRMFKFDNPFASSAGNIEAQQQQLSSNSSGLSTASFKDSRVGGEQSGATHEEKNLFSQLSASGLAKLIGDKIITFKSEVWISEDVSGAAFLEVVTPSSLTEFLQKTILITSDFTRQRVEYFLISKIREDENLSPKLKQRWAEPSAANSTGAFVTPSKADSSELAPATLFHTPLTRELPDRKPAQQPAFLSEIRGRAKFPLDGSTLFNQTTSTQPQASDAFISNPQFSVGGASNSVQTFSTAGAMPLAITIVQPSAEKPKYQILEHIDNEEHVNAWLKKNRKETTLAAKQDRRPLTELISYDAKDELARMIHAANKVDVDIFDKDSPYPLKGWEDVTESLLLKCLFKINGPRSASDAKARLKKRIFHFNNATTEQKFFTPKLRKHIKEFTVALQDFAYCARLWPEHDKELTHFMVVEAFDAGFASQETTKGPDGHTDVLKCSNLLIVREKIRENKAKQLEDIIDVIITHFERHDDVIRANNTDYVIKPWRAVTEKKKRQFNQISAGGGGPAKQPRPPAQFPRCNNCGSKGHLCGERTCYLFGHPKGKGLNGVWPEGTPSLKLTVPEWKEWRVFRHPIFYAYPENAQRANKQQGS